MLSQEEQSKIFYPFKKLAAKFNTELETAREASSNWEKARLINASDVNVPDNHELGEKIEQLETGNAELGEFIAALTQKLQVTDTDFQKTASDLEPDVVRFTSIFNSAKELCNHRYTLRQKNEINKRITVINSSRMLSNKDMADLQEQWSALLGMKNDRRLDESKTIFENRLSDWEKLIEKAATRQFTNKF